MELAEVLQKRRSVRRFTGEMVAPELIDQLLHAAMSGPSACNRTPWEFYVVTWEETVRELRHASRFTGMNAPMAIVVCGMLERALPRDMAEYWIQDCSAATENLLLRAVDLGLGAVWCGIYPQSIPVKRVTRLLNLPEGCIPLNLIWLGHPAEEPEARDQYCEAYIHYI